MEFTLRNMLSLMSNLSLSCGALMCRGDAVRWVRTTELFMREFLYEVPTVCACTSYIHGQAGWVRCVHVQRSTIRLVGN